MNETLAMDQANGYENAVRADQESIDAVQRVWEQVPVEADRIKCEKALFALDTGNQNSQDWSLRECVDTLCISIEFVRHSGGDPVVAQTSGCSPGADTGLSGLYSASLYPETGGIVVDGESNVLEPTGIRWPIPCRWCATAAIRFRLIRSRIAS